MKKVIIYTDGACSGNPGCGGYAAILKYKNIEKEIVGFEENTTNNRMEMLAVIKGLEALLEPCMVEIHSDSQYVISAINEGWLTKWQASGWRTADKKPVKNIDLWQQLVELMDRHKVNFIKVKGHADDEYNNRCDMLAVAQYKNKQNA